MAVVAALALVCFPAGASAAATDKQKTFGSAEEAAKALVEALRADDPKELLAIFGPEGEEIITSGDEVNDRSRWREFVRKYDQKNRLEEENGRFVLDIGDDDWPFPVPLVKKDGRWSFDAREGKEEILNRRIGRNELSTIQTCLAIVDAQREYAMKDRDGNGTSDYAEKFGSSEGKKDGLYWPVKEGEPASPLGPLAAQAYAEGYRKGAQGEPIPYHGYYYRILKAQGKDAPGGAYEYVVKGLMIGGFAVVAYPADYGNSGIMTFIVNHNGVVYEKDLGKDTTKAATAMAGFNPDKSWKKSQ